MSKLDKVRYNNEKINNQIKKIVELYKKTKKTAFTKDGELEPNIRKILEYQMKKCAAICLAEFPEFECKNIEQLTVNGIDENQADCRGGPNGIKVYSGIQPFIDGILKEAGIEATIVDEKICATKVYEFKNTEKGSIPVIEEGKNKYAEGIEPPTSVSSKMVDSLRDQLDYLAEVLKEGKIDIDWMLDVLPHETMHIFIPGKGVYVEGTTELLSREIADKYNLRLTPTSHQRETQIVKLLEKIVGRDVIASINLNNEQKSKRESDENYKNSEDENTDRYKILKYALDIKMGEGTFERYKVLFEKQYDEVLKYKSDFQAYRKAYSKIIEELEQWIKKNPEQLVNNDDYIQKHNESKLDLVMKYQEEEIRELDKIIVKEGLPQKINSEFVKKHFGNIAQAKLGLGRLNEFEDALIMNGLAGIDCTDIDFSELTQEEFENFPFDSSTKFSEETIAQFRPAEILEKGKKFGLGLEEIPLTGKGIHIAIRDQNCNPYLIDVNIVDYTRIENGKIFKEINSDDVEYMHGKTVISLLASKSCGVAKDSKVNFFSGTIEEYVEYIINYNNMCKQQNKENEMILVASGSWNDREFIKHQEVLRSVGCELICANNFDKNFNEFTNNGGNIQVPLDFSQEELSDLIEKYSERESIIKAQAERKDNVKIPISRTYHQVGEDGGFKYQSTYSTSWGIPQVAGLFAVFKEMDRNLTFEQFCEYAHQTAKGDLRIINPDGIYKEIEKFLSKGKSGIDDCMQDEQLRFSTEQEATKVVKEAILGKEKLVDKTVQEK